MELATAIATLVAQLLPLAAKWVTAGAEDRAAIRAEAEGYINNFSGTLAGLAAVEAADDAAADQAAADALKGGTKP